MGGGFEVGSSTAEVTSSPLGKVSLWRKLPTENGVLTVSFRAINLPYGP